MIESSPKKNIFLQWLKWRYSEVPRFIIRVFRNLLSFGFNYFSITLLLRTIFSPWRRYYESYGRGFDLKRYSRVFIGNTISRIIGFIIRGFTIIIGLAAQLVILFGGAFILFAWTFLPLIVVIISFSGLKLLLSL